MAEKLDYQPGVFSVERHVRGKWACSQCQTLVQAPVAPHIIDKGIPTTGLLAQVLVAEYADHLPLYRQESIFARAGLAIPLSTLAHWVGACGVQLQPLVDPLKDELLAQPVLHADETPVAMLKPGHGATHRAYLWSYCTAKFSPVKPPSSTSPKAAQAAMPIIPRWLARDACEREVQDFDSDRRRMIRQQQGRPAADALHAWLSAQRQRVPDGTATAKAIDYSLGRWKALTRYLDDGALPIDNNWVENQSALLPSAAITRYSLEVCALENVPQP